MDAEYSIPSSKKHSSLPLILGGAGLGFGILGLVVGITAQLSLSKLTDLEKKVEIVATAGTDTKKLKDKITLIDQQIAGVGNANNALAMQVDGLRKETQKALEVVSTEINKNREMISNLPARSVSTRSTATSTTTAGGTTPTEPVPVDGMYVVQPGDTLTAIGTRLGISWQKIAEANPDVNPNRLRVGQQLRLP